ncbi:MAG TPA: sulfatase-like hydrolase/transferase, partial [Syntrophales bacterium]|nr:sulfatase-like hydrolase/transferase [Syntrophales bacterium]
FLESPENYRNQLDYADHILGKFIDRLKKNNKFETSTIILLSDHNIRSMYPENKNAIPLIVKGVGQKSKKDFNSPVNAEVILFDELRRLHSKSEASFSR